MSRRPPPDQRLRRREASRLPATRLWVFSEGRNTEPGWLDRLNQGLRGVCLEIVLERGCGVPCSVVGLAVEKRREIKRLGRRDLAANDEVWVVFDRDEHPDVPAALTQARDAGLGVAFSNPCFELWPMFHMDSQTAWIERRPLQSRVGTLHPGYDHARGARLDWAALKPAHDAALQRAVSGHLRAASRGDVLDNPSTTAWLLDQRVRHPEDRQGRWFLDRVGHRPELAGLADLLPAPLRARVQAALTAPLPPSSPPPPARGS